MLCAQPSSVTMNGSRHMSDFSSPFSAASAAPPRGSAWRVYARLVGYAWRYKARLFGSMALAILIAVSFGAMLVGVGTVIRLTFYQPAAQAPEGGGTPAKAQEDPAQGIARDIAEYSGMMRRYVGWGPEGLDRRFLDVVAGMRADRMRALLYACALVTLLAGFVGVSRFFQEYLAATIGVRVTTDIGRDMYANLMRQSMVFFETRNSGEILARFSNDMFMVNRGLEGVFVKLMREPFKIAAFLAVALSVDFKLTLVGVCVMPVVLYALVFIGKKMRKSVRRSLQKIASMTTVVGETVRGMAVIKSYNMEEYEIGRMRGEIDRLRKFLYRMARLHAATGPVTEFLLVLGVVSFVLYSGHRVEEGLLDAGALVQLYFALAMMLDPVRKLSDVNNLVQTSVASAERCFELVDAVPDIVEAPEPVELAPLRDALRLENVSFSYNGVDKVLDDVTLEVRRGEMIALVGPSGAGKSTLVKLIPRYYDATSGRVMMDGVDIRKASFHSLREQIGIVTQDTILFAESVRANIAFGRAEYPEERVRAAARAAHAAAFIDALPEGFETVIGESGNSLSGGQRQRLAIARAIIKDPAVLILDEATSSLDSESERLIQEALDHFVAGRTTIVIAHRLSTVRRADRIVVMENGRIVEQGTHDELLARGGLYRRLHDTQFRDHPVRTEPRP